MPLPEEILNEVPEEYRDNETLARFNNVGDLAKSFVETKAMVGNSIRVPGEDAGDEARKEFIDKLMNRAPELMLKPDFAETEQADEFYRTLGKPQEASEYSTPEDMALPSEVEAQLREVGFKANITDRQMSALFAEFNAMHNANAEKAKEAREADKEVLNGKWGEARDERLRAARKANDEFFPGRDFDTLTSDEIQGLYGIHKAVHGQGAQVAAQPEQQVAMSPDEANMQAEEIMKRIMTTPDMTAAEKDKLMAKRIKILTQYAGYDGSVEGMRSGFG